MVVALAAMAADMPPESTPLGAFALPDSSGTEVIALSPISNPKQIRHLITRDGRVLEAAFARTQPPSKGGSGRDATWNFRYLDGAVFRIRGGTIAAEETCFLIADSLLEQAAPVPLTRVITVLAQDHAAVRSAERSKSRSVIHAWRLACAGKDTCVLLLEFEPHGTNRLLSIVLWQSGSIAMLDQPAEVDEDPSSVWRVGDEGHVDPEAFDVEFLLRGRSGSFVATEWSGEEGLSLELLRVKGQRLEEVYSSYRYLSPG
jgi:hypothetical protein